MATMNIASWNINGLRSILKKGNLHEFLEKHKPTYVCLQEVRCDESIELGIPNYEVAAMNCSKTKKGYSGVALLYRKGSEVPETTHLHEEGRVIVAHFKAWTLITAYVPNSGQKGRLDYRIDTWGPWFSSVIAEAKKPLVLCADWNVAPQEIDLANPGPNKKHAGFTIEEREQFAEMLATHELVDIWRQRNPEARVYTWWSNFAKSRERNVGWRIDSFLVSKSFAKAVTRAEIHTEVLGSDHAPISITIRL